MSTAEDLLYELERLRAIEAAARVYWAAGWGAGATHEQRKAWEDLQRALDVPKR